MSKNQGTIENKGLAKIEEIRAFLTEIINSDADEATKANARKMAVAKMRRISSANFIVGIPEILEDDAAKEDEKAAKAAAKDAAKQAKIDAIRQAREERLNRAKSGETYKTLSQHFRPLGFNEGKYYFLPRSSQQIIEMTAQQMGSAANLFQLAPEEVWISTFGNDQGQFFPSSAAGFLMNGMCIPNGIYSPRNTRGRGVWTDRGRIVVHLGDRLIVDGAEVAITDFQTSFTYALGEALDADLSKPLTAEEGRQIRRIIGMSRFDKPASATLLAGYVFVAPVCGALAWRPHVYMIGPAQSGKSALYDVISNMLGNVAVSASGTDSSSAGIRQRLRYDSLPVIFDEFEAEDKNAGDSLRAIMALARQASSDTGARALKGTKDGLGTDYVIRSSFLFSSINLNVHARADEERVIVVGLTASDGANDNGKWDERNALVAKLIDENTPSRLMARAVRMLPTLKERIKTFRAVVLKTDGLKSERTADQIGTLLAGAWCLQHDTAISEQEAQDFVASQDWKAYTPDSLPEADRLLSAIMQGRSDDLINNVRPLIGEMIDAIVDRSGYCEADLAAMERSLARCGMKVVDGELYISTNASKIKEILKDTPWHSRYNTVLKSKLGVTGGGTKRFAGRTDNTLKISIGQIVITEEAPVAVAA